MNQSGQQVRCPQTGKMKNCGSKDGVPIWADYEEGHSGSAALCNGGIFDNDSYDACPSRPECQRATEINRIEEEDRKRRLPVLSTNGRLGSTQIVGATPAAQRSAMNPTEPADPTRWRPTYDANRPTMPARSTQLPQQPQQQYYDTRYREREQSYPHYAPQPVMPPQQFPMAMQTPYAAPVPFHAGGISPTFLPDRDESLPLRLLKNVGQGAIASTGWHVFDFARTVDFFGRRR